MTTSQTAQLCAQSRILLTAIRIHTAACNRPRAQDVVCTLRWHVHNNHLLKRASAISSHHVNHPNVRKNALAHFETTRWCLPTAARHSKFDMDMEFGDSAFMRVPVSDIILYHVIKRGEVGLGLRSHAYRARTDVITTNSEVSMRSCVSHGAFGTGDVETFV